MVQWGSFRGSAGDVHTAVWLRSWQTGATAHRTERLPAVRSDCRPYGRAYDSRAPSRRFAVGMPGKMRSPCAAQPRGVPCSAGVTEAADGGAGATPQTRAVLRIRARLLQERSRSRAFTVCGSSRMALLSHVPPPSFVQVPAAHLDAVRGDGARSENDAGHAPCGPDTHARGRGRGRGRGRFLSRVGHRKPTCCVGSAFLNPSETARSLGSM